MTGIRVFITGVGIISPVGEGLAETRDELKTGESGLKPLTLFPVPGYSHPVGEISLTFINSLPRTHNLAMIAVKEAMKEAKQPPDAIILGSTTGGMPLTENFIKEKNFDPDLFKYHATGSVAEYIAGELKCHGPVLTVSTACSSGTLAIKLALEMIRCGMAKTVLTGGVDALCRLTYHGFNSLQLLDPIGARPLDAGRKGMSIAEGAAMLLMSAHEIAPKNAIVEILGAGLSCDAYHPASPHPEGVGAAKAMKAAIEDAGISAESVDYINLHGTGTIDNDLAEAKAIRAVFGERIPELSSIKGATGHSLAAAGAIEAVISAAGITDNFIPANTGCVNPDPSLGIIPAMKPVNKEVKIVLSNSFGFGGNNASVIISSPVKPAIYKKITERKTFSVLRKSCLTGAGDLENTIDALRAGGKCKGMTEIDKASGVLAKNKIRRLKRLPKMVLSLAVSAAANTEAEKPSSIYFGTGWGALSDTYDFLEKLFESGEQFPSPTDFIGSVHNAPAGQAAIWFGSTGANVTATGGDYSFEQALLSASLLSGWNEPVLLIGADEHHNILSNSLDGSAGIDKSPSDGGAAFLLKKDDMNSGLKIYPSFFEFSRNNENVIKSLIENLGGAERIKNSFGAFFAGIPAAMRKQAEVQLAEFKSLLLFDSPVIDYRKLTGEFASASAVAAAVAMEFVADGKVPEICHFNEFSLEGKGILILGLGDFITAVEVHKN